MKLGLVLVAATLLAGCGAELPPPEPTPPTLRGRFWGYLEVLGRAAENVTARLNDVPLFQKLRSLAEAVGERAETLAEGLRAEARGARDRAAEYGAEARAALEGSWGELKSRGASYARKLRKRLHRDGEELRRRWGAAGQAWEEGLEALRKSWGAKGEPPKL